MIVRYKLFTTPMCPNCPDVKEFMKTTNLEGEVVDASDPKGLQEASVYGISSVPTVVFLDEDNKVVNTATTIEEIKRIIENKSLKDI